MINDYDYSSWAVHTQTCLSAESSNKSSGWSGRESCTFIFLITNTVPYIRLFFFTFFSLKSILALPTLPSWCCLLNRGCVSPHTPNQQKLPKFEGRHHFRRTSLQATHVFRVHFKTLNTWMVWSENHGYLLDQQKLPKLSNSKFLSLSSSTTLMGTSRSSELPSTPKLWTLSSSTVVIWWRLYPSSSLSCYRPLFIWFRSIFDWQACKPRRYTSPNISLQSVPFDSTPLVIAYQKRANMVIIFTLCALGYHPSNICLLKKKGEQGD